MRRLPLILPAALAAAVVATDPARAEVRVSLTGSPQKRVSAVIEMWDLDGTNGIWSKVTSGDDFLILNPGGHAHGDGPPSIQINSVTQLPEAVWAFKIGRAMEIVWSRFDGEAWTSPVALTSGGRSFDPRLSIDDAGNRRVAFWRRGLSQEPDGLYVTTLPHAETQWWLPQRISLEGVPTRRPDIRTYPSYGTFLVAEEETPDGLTISVFNLPVSDGSTPPQRDSDPWGRQQVHMTGPKTWGLGVELVARPGSGGEVPQIQWVEGQDSSMLGTIYYDTQSLTWSRAFFVPVP